MPKTTRLPFPEKPRCGPNGQVRYPTDFTDAFTKQTGVLFSYESALASMPMGDVSVRESNAPLERILNNVFTKRGFRYKIVDRTVVLTYDRTASRSGRTA
ncbi:MAG: STN domain-containing protein [Alistipes finegoldii]